MYDLLHLHPDTDSIPHSTLATAPQEGGSGFQVLGPPFQAPWKIIRAQPQIFWTALRSFVTSGQFVGQLGVREATSQRRFGFLEVGVQRRFKARESGPHRIIVNIAAGPITRIGPVSVFAFAFIDGVGRRTAPLNSHRTSQIHLEKDLQKDQWYTVVAAGFVGAFTGPGFPEAYGEVIASVPKITVFKKPLALENEVDEYFTARNRQIEQLGSVEAVATEIAGEPETLAEYQPLSLDEALEAEKAEGGIASFLR